MLMMLGFFFLITSIYAQEGFLYCESLNDGDIPENTVFGGHARFVSDALGNGVLQLTSNQREQSGYLYVDIPFPSTYGIKASFEYFSYGGDGNADGMVFFLFDAAVSAFQPGGFGGALGYAFNSAHQAPGLTGAYIGIGLDEYGNFTNAIEGKDGPGFRPNNITIRGPGSGFEGYEYITGIRTDQEAGGLAEEDQFPLSSGGLNTSRVTDLNKAGYRKVFIDLQPATDGQGMILSMEMLVTTVDNEPRVVSVFKDFPYDYIAPENLKIGFAAATGGYTNFHEIRNIVVEVSDDKNLQLPEAMPISEKVCEGESTEFEISEDDVLLPNQNSIISCLQLYRTLEEIPDAEEQDPCSNSTCNPIYQRLELDQGLFTVDAAGSGISFLAASGFDEEEVTVYYTVTDNYGQTSKPQPFKVGIFGFPAPPVVFEAQEFEEDDRSPAEAFRLCEGEKIWFKAFSPMQGTFQWFKDGVRLEGEVTDRLEVSSAGVYSAWVFNEANCSSMSQEVVVAYPMLPEVVIEDLIVSCGEELVDLRPNIEGYDDKLYDYEATAPDGRLLLNEALASLDQAGVYVIRAKHKDLDCWSGFFTTELIMVENPVEADFEYAVIMDDGGQEMVDIFINDPIQFTDLSLQHPIAWEWDFGDGEQSTEQHPQHAYSDEGNYNVTLTVYDEDGYCSSSHHMEVNVTRSYRIMYPTAFTPTGNENQFFKPKTKGIRAISLYIFNSWGNLIYVSNDINDQGWDGTSVGKLQPQGNYVFKVEFTTVLGEKVTDAGKFVLIR